MSTEATLSKDYKELFRGSKQLLLVPIAEGVRDIEGEVIDILYTDEVVTTGARKESAIIQRGYFVIARSRDDVLQEKDDEIAQLKRAVEVAEQSARNSSRALQDCKQVEERLVVQGKRQTRQLENLGDVVRTMRSKNENLVGLLSAVRREIGEERMRQIENTNTEA